MSGAVAITDFPSSEFKLFVARKAFESLLTEGLIECEESNPKLISTFIQTTEGQRPACYRVIDARTLRPPN